MYEVVTTLNLRAGGDTGFLWPKGGVEAVGVEEEEESAFQKERNKKKSPQQSKTNPQLHSQFPDLNGKHGGGAVMRGREAPPSRWSVPPLAVRGDVRRAAAVAVGRLGPLDVQVQELHLQANTRANSITSERLAQWGSLHHHHQAKSFYGRGPLFFYIWDFLYVKTVKNCDLTTYCPCVRKFAGLGSVHAGQVDLSLSVIGVKMSLNASQFTEIHEGNSKCINIQSFDVFQHHFVDYKKKLIE